MRHIFTLETTSGDVRYWNVDYYISFKDRDLGEKAWIGDGSGR